MSIDTIKARPCPPSPPEVVETKGDVRESKRSSRDNLINSLAQSCLSVPSRGRVDNTDSKLEEFELDAETFAFIHGDEVDFDEEAQNSYFPEGFAKALFSAKRIASHALKFPTKKDRAVDFHLQRLKDQVRLQGDVDWAAHGYSKHYLKQDKGAVKFKAAKRQRVLEELVSKGYDYKIVDGKVQLLKRFGPEAEAARILVGSVSSSDEIKTIAKGKLEQEALIHEGYSYEIRGGQIVLVEKPGNKAAEARDALEGVISDTYIIDVFRKEALKPVYVEESYQVEVDSKGNVKLLGKRGETAKNALKKLRAAGVSKEEIASIAKTSYQKEQLIFTAYGYKRSQGQLQVVQRSDVAAIKARESLEAMGTSPYTVEAVLQKKAHTARMVHRGYDYHLDENKDFKKLSPKSGPEAKAARAYLDSQRISKASRESAFFSKARVIRMIDEAFTYSMVEGGVQMAPKPGLVAKGARNVLESVYSLEDIARMCLSLATKGKI